MSHCRQSPELAIESKSPESLQQILPTVALEVWGSDMLGLQSWRCTRQIFTCLSSARCQSRISQTEVQAGNSVQLCPVPHGLAYSPFYSSRTSAAGSGVWCRSTSSLLKHPLDVIFGISSLMQWFSDSSSLLPLLYKLPIHIKPSVPNLCSFPSLPWGGGNVGTQACYNAFSITTNLESSLKMSINPNSFFHIAILTVKVFPFWWFY